MCYFWMVCPKITPVCFLILCCLPLIDGWSSERKKKEKERGKYCGSYEQPKTAATEDNRCDLCAWQEQPLRLYSTGHFGKNKKKVGWTEGASYNCNCMARHTSLRLRKVSFGVTLSLRRDAVPITFNSDKGFTSSSILRISGIKQVETSAIHV